jgi:hypothetical protein
MDPLVKPEDDSRRGRMTVGARMTVGGRMTVGARMTARGAEDDDKRAHEVGE